MFYAQTLIFVILILITIYSFSAIILRVSELQAANLTECLIGFPSMSLYLPGPVVEAVDPSCLAPKLSSENYRALNFQHVDHHEDL